MVQRVYYGPVTDSHNADMPDLKPREWAAAAPLCALAIIMGVFPTFFLKPIGAVGQARGRTGAGEPEPEGRLDRIRRPRSRRAACVPLHFPS
jgi:hypothetical protein